MSIITCLGFLTLVNKLFELQIINGQDYQNALNATYETTVRIPALRGTIYDRYGRPLAINTSAFSVKIDPAFSPQNPNYAAANLIELFEKTGQEYVDDFPISDEPFEFLFSGSTARENRWKKDMEISTSADAEKAFLHLRKFFSIPEELSHEQARKILSIRSMVYLQRYNQTEHITIAFNALQDTIVSLEEENEKYEGVYIDVESLREYPQGQYFSHILGYIRKISDVELEANKDKGYTNTDLFGKSGLELSFEQNLRGIDGEKVVLVTDIGRPISTISTSDSTQGDRIFLTVDSNLQQKAFHILEDTLTEVIKGKLLGRSTTERPLTERQFFSSLIRNYVFDMRSILEAEENTFQDVLKKYILSELPDATASTDAELREAINVLIEGVNSGAITSVQLLLAMSEQEIITLDDIDATSLLTRRLSPMSVILSKLDSKEITPQMTNLDPSTGSIVVVDVETGGILAAVTYPSYDNNQFVNNFNNRYWNKINSYDRTTPLINRPFSEPNAPGSTFKMITALAALEAGAINTSTLIRDNTTFTSAGVPYLRCWSPSSHGLIDVASALEVSCNYFFCESAYRMGNSKNAGTYTAISGMNALMRDFGLDQRTGVEIGELYDNNFYRELPIRMSSPEYKERIALSRNPGTPRSELIWYDGDTVQTSIGQGSNAYTSATMAKYIATLATGGERMKLHLLGERQTYDGQLIEKTLPTVEKVVEIQPQNWDIVYRGMEQVITGPRGTARAAFAGLPVTVSGKTGTAEEAGGPSHSSFGGFAPSENPEIAIYVSIPRGDTRVTLAPSSLVARRVIEEYMGLNNEPEKEFQKNMLVQ